MNHHNKSKNILKKVIHIVIFLSIILSNDLLFTQNFKLKLFAIDSIENSILNKIEFQKKHKTKSNLTSELKSISKKLKKEGFFFNTIDSLIKKESYTVYISLNKRYQKIVVKNLLKSDSIPINEIENYLFSITNKLEEEGKLFSEISLTNITSEGNTLFADLKTTTSKTRTINKLIVNGYNKISENYLNHLLDLKKQKTLNKSYLKKTSAILNALPFLSETKNPQTLFTKDSTVLYIYLKQEKSNNFEGLLNFGPKSDNKGIVFTGYLNLALNNILHKGEQLNLKWRANGNESQNLTLRNKIPYLFNTPISSELTLNIHKQDSSFLSSNFTARLLYNINPKIKTGIIYNNETSQNTLLNTTESISSYKSNFYGAYFEIKSLSKNIFNENVFLFELAPAFGTRNSSSIKVKQTKLKLTTSYILKINNKNSILTKAHLGYLISEDKTLTNELFRIGGYSNLRGIEQESFFTNQYNIFNSEYRFKVSEKSILYTITDFAQLNNSLDLKEKLYTLGIGYQFKIKSSLFNINYASNNSINDSFSLSKSKLNLTFLNFF